MKSKFKFLLFIGFLAPSLLQGQPENKHMVYLTSGKAYYIFDQPIRNFSIGVAYQYRPFKAFSFDGFYLYSQSNSFPSFFDDKAKLHDFILGQNISNFTLFWSEVYTHSVGLRPHYSIINNNRWHLSINFAFGIALSKSSIQGYDRFSWHPVSGQIIDYELDEPDKGSISGLFVSPGLQLHFTFYRNFIIGIDPNLHYFKPGADYDTLNSIPSWPEFINLSIMIGKKL